MTTFNRGVAKGGFRYSLKNISYKSPEIIPSEDLRSWWKSLDTGDINQKQFKPNDGKQNFSF